MHRTPDSRKDAKPSIAWSASGSTRASGSDFTEKLSRTEPRLKLTTMNNANTTLRRVSSSTRQQVHSQSDQRGVATDHHRSKTDTKTNK